MQVKNVDRILAHGYVITVDEKRRIIRDGAVAIKDGVIQAVGKTGEILKEYSGEIFDCKGGVVHPGLIDAHEHLCQHITHGWEPDTFSVLDTWVNFERLAYPAITETEEIASVEIATIEMVKNGTTCFSDTGSAFYPFTAIETANKVGIRGITGRCGGDMFIDELAFLSRPVKEILDEMEAYYDHFRDCRVRMGTQLCGMGDCSDDLILGAKEIAKKHDDVLFMHQCVYESEVEAYHKKWGKGPIRHLYDLGVLDDKTTLVHMVHLEDGDVDILKETGTNVVHCPGASMKFGLGAFSRGKFPEMYEAGLNIGLGSDSGTWCDSLDILMQTYLAAVGHREARCHRTVINSFTAFEMATIGGARAIGMGDKIGSLEVGKLADIVIHNTDCPEAKPMVDPFMNLIFATRSKTVDTVLVNGEYVLLHGRVMNVSESETYEKAEGIATAFKERIGYPTYSKWEII